MRSIPCRRSHPLAALLALIVTLVIGTAQAEPKQDPEWHLSGYQGMGWMTGKHTGGITADALGLAHWRFMRAGAALQLVAPFSIGLGLGLLAGAGVEAGPWHFDLLGEVGSHSYAGVGMSFLGDDPGTGATLPYAGGRLGVACDIFRRRRVSLALSSWFSYAQDLHTVTRSYHYTQTDWLFDNDSHDAVATHVIGQSQWSLTFGVTATLPL